MKDSKRPNTSLVLKFIYLSKVSAVLSILIGTLALLGHAFDVASLKSINPDWVTMKVNTAIAFIFAGPALWLSLTDKSSKHRHFLGNICALVVMLIGGLTLSEYIFGWDLGIDQGLFPEAAGAVQTFHLGRMPMSTALCFLLLGMSLTFFDVKTRLIQWSTQWLILSVAFLSLLEILGYLYGTVELTGISGYTKMAVHTAVLLFILSLGILFARPSHGFMAVASSDAPGSQFLRRVTPAVFFVLFFVGVLRFGGEQRGFFGTNFGVIIFLALTFMIFLLVIWKNANILNRVDLERVQLFKTGLEYKRLFNLSLDMICITNSDGNFLEINSAFEKILGYAKEELLVKSLIDLVHPDDLAATIAEVEKLATGTPNVYFENRYRCKNGAYKILGWTSYPVKEEGLLFAVARDITDIKRLNQERERTEFMLKSAERINGLVQHSLDAVVGMSDQGLITSWNPQAEKIFGWEKKDAIGHNLANLIIPSMYREAHRKGLAKFLATGGGPILNQRIEVNGLRRGQVEFPIELAVNPLQEPHGWLFYAFVRDISDRKKWEQQQQAILEREKLLVQKLEEEHVLRERFVSALTHDLRTPMTVAKMTAEVLLRKAETPETMKNMFDRIIRNMDRADLMIRDLLDANRIKAGEGIPISIVACHLDQIIAVVVKDLSELHGPRFQVRNEAGQLIGHWDSKGIQRITENLVSNAIKYGKADSPITIRLKSENVWAEIAVHNEGNAISHEDQQTLFKPYHRTESAITGKQKGWGIGLTLVKGLIEAHGGTVRIESEPGLGTTFFVRLPLDARTIS
ncbi:MAG TPA: PAS domain S-box protein [Bacteriovoracaceae bacterium]|nr:PAS domain S-box protein [Bacteriovoracaceae bacterium]